MSVTKSCRQANNDGTSDAAAYIFYAGGMDASTVNLNGTNEIRHALVKYHIKPVAENDLDYC